MSQFDRLMGKIHGQAKDDRRRAKLDAKVMPLVAKLKRGRNYFDPKQYCDIVRHQLGYDREAYHALRDGRFAMGSIELVRVKWLKADRLASIADLAKLTGLPYRRMAEQLANTNLPWKRVRGKKMFDIDMLRTHLERFADAK